MKRKATPQNERTGSGNKRKWSQTVTQNSNALDLEPETFRGSAEQVAAALKRSAVRSRRRKSSPFRSAMSMLNFFINRAGSNLGPDRRAVLESAKDKLREAFGKTQSGG
jgi:hypothetical protein